MLSPWEEARLRAKRNPEREARKLKRRFRAVTDRYLARRNSRRRVRHFRSQLGTMIVGFAAGAVAVYMTHAWLWTSNLWPSAQSMLEGRFVRSCAAAREFGVTPLYKGFPGYRADLDADGDGIACEPFW